MKRIFIIFSIFISWFLISCSESKIFNIYLPDGTPVLALANLLQKNDNRFSINIVNPTEIASSVASNDCQMAILPTISAAKLYKKNNVDIKLVSCNIFGSLYIASKSSVASLDDFKGHIIYSTAGTTVDLLKYILNKNNIKYNMSTELKSDEVSIATVSSAQEIIPLLNSKNDTFGILGEPVLSQALNKIDGLNIALDLQIEYQKINNESSFPQACFVVKTSFANNNCKVLEEIISLLEDNKSFLNNNVEKLNDILKNYSTTLKNLKFSQELIKRCNVDYQNSTSVKQSVNKYVYDIGDIILDDEFYY